ncbi:MAG: hypothetical protein JWN44_1505 [Myxococcales bacterium]|nr:hypothetical protein [Myxococcales bacterium]
MKSFASIMFALATAVVAGCGSPNINHGGTGGSGGTGGGGGSGTGGNGGTGGSGGGGSGGGGGGTGNNCGVQDFMLTKGGTPDLLLIQDRSGSMSMDASGGNTTPSKWTSMTTALKQVVSAVSTVEWGLLMFPDANGGGFNTCSVPTMPDVAISATSAGAISTALTNAMPGGGTPTGEAIKSAVTYLKGLANGHTHYLLVATDGEPTCNDDQNTTVAAITNAVSNGIKVFVVGIANTGADATLTAMANAGGVPNMTAGQKPYYEASTSTDLVNVLNKVTGQLVSCSYALQKAPANPDLVEIDGNGMIIPRDKTHMNGWDYGPNNLSINFYGMACDALQKGVITMVTAIYGCPPIG